MFTDSVTLQNQQQLPARCLESSSKTTASYQLAAPVSTFDESMAVSYTHLTLPTIYSV